MPNTDISFVGRILRPFKLCAFGITAALSLAMAGRRIEALKVAISPLGYWRFVPIAYLLHYAGQIKACRILDVSSPKLVSLYLARQNGCEVHAIDLDDQKLVSRWGVAAKALKLKNYNVSFQDARHLQFPDSYFDLAYSISVIEHIPENGDTQALQEVHRVLKSGGLALIEIPYRRKGEEVYRLYDSKGAPTASGQPQFYERHYDSISLERRLTVPGMKIEKRLILGEWLPLDPWIAANRLPRPLRAAILPFEPLLAAANYWARPNDERGRPLAALLIYRKS